MSVTQSLDLALAEAFGRPLANALVDQHAKWLARHGNWDDWCQARDRLPALAQRWRIQDGCLIAGEDCDQPAVLTEQLKSFIPWRKGPLCLGGVAIDTEWRSDFKWARLAEHVDLRDEQVLDVGAGNAYFGWCMLAAGARQVFGCDPTQLFVAQHEVIRHFAGPAPNHLIAARLEDLPQALNGFDRVFSMGVLYHRRDPLEHLNALKARLRPGGGLILETLILDGPGDQVLVPPDRYANMRNVHALPTRKRLEQWLQASGWTGIECIDCTYTTSYEQRQTEWMPFHSLSKALSADDPKLTREGLPAPLRAIFLAQKPV